MKQIIDKKIPFTNEELSQSVERESVTAERLESLLKDGSAVLLKNRARNIRPVAVGRELTTKVNANIGTSKLNIDSETELEKLRIAVAAGADTVMDLSTGGDLDVMRKRIIEESPVPVGTVPVYALMTRGTLTKDSVLNEIEAQASQGVDYFTIHAGITKRSLSYIRQSQRIAGVVSRGGAYIAKWMNDHSVENPFYEAFDEILSICAAHRVAVSLGDGLRPGACADAGDSAQIAELLELGGLVQRCREAGVQVFVEGPGHVPLDQVADQVRLAKRLCGNAPLYVLGPLTLDNGCGHDHITGAIGGAIASSAGADFLCYVTPAEHLCLPGKEDVREGIIASVIAARSGDMLGNAGNVRETNDAISKARKNLDWDKVFSLAIDPELSRKRRRESMASAHGSEECSMCGEFCSMRMDGRK